MDAVGGRAAAAALFELIRAGDLPGFEAALARGADPDAQDRLGRSALHAAVDEHRPEFAARLLQYGADPIAGDRTGATPFAGPRIRLDELHRVRQIYRRLPDPPFTRPELSDAACVDALCDLERHGIAKLPGMVCDAVLVRLRREFRAFVSDLDGLLARGEGRKRHYDEESHYWPKERAYITNNAFKYSRALLELATTAFADIARCYYGKEVFIQRAVAMRYLPVEVAGSDMFRWHHDTEDKLFKVMVLLTHVGDSDQYMSYVPATHKLFHSLERFNDNAIDPPPGHLPIVRATGRAGDVYLFDANGVHSANRCANGAVRDVFLVEFTCDHSDITGGSVALAPVGRTPPTSANPLSAMALWTPKWSLRQWRRNHTWVDNLSFPGLWTLHRSSGPPGRVELKLIYVVFADGLDEGWTSRFRASLKSAVAQSGDCRLRVCVADFSGESMRDVAASFLAHEEDYLKRGTISPFNRSHCINQAVRELTGSADSCFLVSDIDIVYPPDFADKCWRRYASSGREFCMNAPAYYLTAESSILTDGYIDPLGDGVDYWRVFAGGCCLYSRALFERLRGYDERYEGWGGEDEDFYERVVRSATLITDRSIHLLHLDHPRREEVESEWRDENRARLERKRAGSIPWCDWSRWGEPGGATGAPIIRRHMRPRWTRFGAPRRVDGQYVVQSGTEGFNLNESALIVYRLCGGDRTVGAIVDEITAATGLDQDAVAPDVLATIEVFCRRGMVEIEGRPM